MPVSAGCDPRPVPAAAPQDVHGDSLVEAVFEGVADHLAIESVVRVDLDAVAWPALAIAPSGADASLRLLA